MDEYRSWFDNLKVRAGRSRVLMRGDQLLPE